MERLIEGKGKRRIPALTFLGLPLLRCQHGAGRFNDSSLPCYLINLLPWSTERLRENSLPRSPLCQQPPELKETPPAKPGSNPAWTAGNC